MKTIISLCASLLLLATVGCKQTDNVKTTGSETTATVSMSAPVTDTTPSTAGMTTEPQKSSVKSGKPPTRSGVTSPTVTATVGSTTSKSTPPPANTAPPATEAKPPAAPAPTTSSTPSPAPSSNASLVSTGQSIFKSKCVSCHGADASGNTAMGRKNKIPDLRSSTVQGRSDADLANRIANGTGTLSSSAHKSKHLSSDQVTALVAYVRSLK